MERAEEESRPNDRWSSQQVIRQRIPTDRSCEHTRWQETSHRTKTRLLLNYPVYHRLSTFVIVANTIVILSCCLKARLLDDPQACLEALATNLLVAVLIRLEHVVNFLYHIFGLIPHSMPLRIRRHAASLYHLGGIHSGAALSAILWLVALNFAVARLDATDNSKDIRAILTMSLAGLLDILVIQMVVFSLPTFRHRYHNAWEGIHRWSGWLLLLVFWLYLALYFSIPADVEEEDELRAHETIYTCPVFYISITMTLSNILSWLQLKRVAPRYYKLSDHAIQLFFDDWYVVPCRTPKFSTSPLKEWHAFASIPYLERNGCSVIISRAGDWTSRMIDDPPEYLYIKANPAQGVLYMAKIFKSVLCVVTGSGIAPVLGLLDISGTEFRILWSTRDPESTYGREIIHRILKADQDAIILNTSRNGRSDLVEATERVCATSGIEAVFVISNATVTNVLVKKLRRKGILAYGPIFDS